MAMVNIMPIFCSLGSRSNAVGYLFDYLDLSTVSPLEVLSRTHGAGGQKLSKIYKFQVTPEEKPACEKNRREMLKSCYVTWLRGGRVFLSTRVRPSGSKGSGGREWMWTEEEPSLGRVRRLPPVFGPGDSRFKELEGGLEALRSILPVCGLSIEIRR